MTERIPLDHLTSDQLDALYEVIERVGAIASRLFVACKSETEERIGRELLAALAPLNSQPTGIDPPAYDGPTVAEAAADDRRWWDHEKETP